MPHSGYCIPSLLICKQYSCSSLRSLRALCEVFFLFQLVSVVSANSVVRSLALDRGVKNGYHGGESENGWHNHNSKRDVMKKIAKITVLAGMIIAMTGCQGGQKGDESLRVKLPPEVAGIWKAVESSTPWGIVLSEDGKMIEARIGLASAIIKPNTITKVEMADGQFSTFDVGPAFVDYDPETRELTVAFDLKHFEVRYMNERIMGNSRYAFTGQVSEDGKEWNTILAEEFDYGPRFPMDPNAIGETVIFHKQEPKKK